MSTFADGEALYCKESLSTKFYFLMSGQVHLFAKFNDAEKLTKTISKPQFFGFREDDESNRNENAIANTRCTEVIEFDTKKFYEIIKESRLACKRSKHEFLTRFVPGLRRPEGQLIL